MSSLQQSYTPTHIDPLKVSGRFISMVVPCSLGLFVGMLMTTFNLVFIGHLNDPVKLAAVGMGNMIINMCGIGPYYGLNSGMETLVSQAWGAGHKKLCGEILQRARVVNMIAFIPMSIIFLISPILLRKAGQDEQVIASSFIYMCVMLPAVLFNGFNDLQRKFLNQVGKQNIQMNTQVYGLAIHVTLCFFFVTHFQWGVAGTAFATFLSNLFIFVINEKKTQSEDDLSELNEISIFDSKVYRDFNLYLSIGIPNMLTLFMEFASYEIMILLVGYLGVVQQATQIILLNLIALPQMIAFAFQQASCAMVGQEIGANNVGRSKRIYSILFVLFILGDALTWLVLFLNRFHIAGVFTDSKSIQHMTNYVIWIALVTITESFFKNSLLGIIKALEQQKRAMHVNFFSYMCIVIPMVIFFTFESPKLGLFLDEPGAGTNNRGVGLWVGYVIGIGFQDLGYLYIIASTNWQEIANQAQQRQWESEEQTKSLIYQEDSKCFEKEIRRQSVESTDCYDSI